MAGSTRAYATNRKTGNMQTTLTRNRKSLAAQAGRQQYSFLQLAWLRFRRHKMAIFGAVVLILLILEWFGELVKGGNAEEKRVLELF